MRHGLFKICHEKTQSMCQDGERVAQSYGVCLFLVSGSNKSFLWPASGFCTERTGSGGSEEIIP